MRNILLFTLFFLARVACSDFLYDKILGPVHLYTGVLGSIERQDGDLLEKFQRLMAGTLVEVSSGEIVPFADVCIIDSSIKRQISQKLDTARNASVGDVTIGEVYDVITEGISHPEVDPALFYIDRNSLELAIQLKVLLNFFHKDQSYLFIRECLWFIKKIEQAHHDADLLKYVHAYNTHIAQGALEGPGFFIFEKKPIPLCTINREMLRLTLGQSKAFLEVVVNKTRIGSVSLYAFISALETLSTVYDQQFVSEENVIRTSFYKQEEIPLEFKVAGLIFLFGAVSSHLLVLYKLLFL